MIEKGVWIVYDLEANRKIQHLLQREGFSFRFDPSINILKQEVLKEIEVKSDGVEEDE